MKYVLITGASSGIGECFARRFAAMGYSLVLVARRIDRLEALCKELTEKNPKILCKAIGADLGNMEECKRVMKEVANQHFSFFINNAGFGDCAYFLEGDIDRELSMIDLNVKALHYFTKEMVKRMDAQKGGHILNVGSSAGLFPAGPYMATYYATKSYVVSFSRAVAEELRSRKSPVYLGVLCPGPVETEFNQVANVKFALKGITVDQCVDYALRKMKAKKVTIVPSFVLRLGVFGGRFLPTGILVRIVARQQMKKIYEKK